MRADPMRYWHGVSCDLTCLHVMLFLACQSIRLCSCSAECLRPPCLRLPLRLRLHLPLRLRLLHCIRYKVNSILQWQGRRHSFLSVGGGGESSVVWPDHPKGGKDTGFGSLFSRIWGMTSPLHLFTAGTDLLPPPLPTRGIVVTTVPLGRHSGDL